MHVLQVPVPRMVAFDPGLLAQLDIKDHMELAMMLQGLAQVRGLVTEGLLGRPWVQWRKCNCILVFVREELFHALHVVT